MFRYPVINLVSDRQNNRNTVTSALGTDGLPWDRHDEEIHQDCAFKLYVCNSTELDMPRSFKEEKFFRLVQTHSNHRETILDEGKVDYEKIHTSPTVWRRRIRLQGKKVQNLFIDVPEPKPVPQSVVSSGFKNVIDQIAESRK